ncbi:MAG TPA: hypothetical protein PKX92_12005 [Edaphocola sp.]|nr:hypothetical protein [Edaphocola sp.]
MSDKILESLQNPISYLETFLEFEEINKNSNFNPFDNDECNCECYFASKYIAFLEQTKVLYYTYVSGRSSDIKIEKFKKLKEFHKLFCVYEIFENRRVYSKKDGFETVTKNYFALFFKDIRVEDGYIKSIIKDTLDELYFDNPNIRYKYHLSIEETVNFHNNYNLANHCNFLAYSLNSKILGMGKTELQTVFHELGHILSHYLMKHLGYDLGRIERIALLPNESSVNLKDNPFWPKNKDDGDEIIKIKQYQLENIEHTLSYLIYILGGGIFNFNFFNPKPNHYDFKVSKVFKHNPDGLRFGTPAYRAGDDYQKKALNLWMDINTDRPCISLDDFIQELFYVFDNIGIFNIGKSILDHFDENFNGKIIENNEEIEAYFTSKVSFFHNTKIEIENLISKYTKLLKS